MLNFYKEQSLFTEPGKYNEVLDQLPSDMETLVKTVQNIVIHQFWIVNEDHYGFGPKQLLALGRDPNKEINYLNVEQILDKYFEINPASLSVEREPIQKVVGNCRDFTLLLVSLLRHKNIAARSRSGVATYFIEGHFEDHFVCEYYNEESQSWTLVDAQLDELMMKKLSIDFDPLCVPSDQFLNAAQSYDSAKENGNPNDFGIDEYIGQKFIHYKVFSDLAHLAKFEILPWEGWGIGDRFASEKTHGGDMELLIEMLENINDDKVNHIKKLFSSNDNFKQPDNYEPFYLELPFFK